jgi:hypothetical protein
MNELWRHYLGAVRQVRPDVFVIENVPEFLKSGQYAAFNGTCRSDRILSQYVVEARSSTPPTSGFRSGAGVGSSSARRSELRYGRTRPMAPAPAELISSACSNGFGRNSAASKTLPVT